MIPARSGSKGVPNKNIKLLGGYPLIAYAICASRLSSEISRTIVSTDSPEYAEIAKKYGAEVPFLRPPEISQAKSLDIEFIQHAIQWFDENEGLIPDILVHIRPTTPLRDPEIIDEAIRLFQKDSQATSLRSVHELAESPHKVFNIDSNGYLKGLFPDDPRPEYYNLPRQSFPTAYHPNGYVDIIRCEFVQKNDSLHGQKMIGFITPVSIEVDRREDFEYLEYLLTKEKNPVLEYLKSNFPEEV